MNTPGAYTKKSTSRAPAATSPLVFMFVALLAIPLGHHGAFPPICRDLPCSPFIFLVKGMYMLQPNQSALMMLFGAYRGTDYSTGLRWANPFLNKTKVSLRLRNFNSEKLKVNDKRGNPIEIAAAVVWRVKRHGARGARHRPLRAVRARAGGVGAAPPRQRVLLRSHRRRPDRS